MNIFDEDFDLSNRADRRSRLSRVGAGLATSRIAPTIGAPLPRDAAVRMLGSSRWRNRPEGDRSIGSGFIHPSWGTAL